MRVLAIETATQACSVALFDEENLLASQHELIGRGHAERLVPMISDLPGKGRADEIRVSLGPGSFTGTRIGLAAARALGIAWGARVSGFPSLALVAASARATGTTDPVGVAMTGGHGDWFVQSFDATGLPVGANASLRPEEAAASIREHRVAGDRADELVNLRGYGEALDLLPDASHVLSLPPAVLSEHLAPIYGRPPDARLPGG